MTPLANRELSRRAEQSNWGALAYFNAYRLIVALLFSVLSQADYMPKDVSAFDSRLFDATALLYTASAVVTQLVIWRRLATYRWQVYGIVLIDIVAITLLMHAAGGVSSGIGMLLIVSIAGVCLLASARASMFFAALATVALLSDTVIVALDRMHGLTHYTHAGLLGAACFGTAILASVLAERARHSEALAVKRGVDLENLFRLNQQIVQRMRVGIMVLDSNARFVLINDAAIEILGRAETAVSDELANLSRPLFQSWQHWISTGQNPSGTITGAGNVNALVSFTELGSENQDLPGTLVFLEDAAATRQRAQQLKLASLGRLTASIAHEIRNPLGAISHAGQLLHESPQLTTPDRRLANIILEHARRVNAIIENVLSIGRRKEAMSDSFALVPWLHMFINELIERRQLARADIEVRWVDESIVVKMDRTQLHQVLWNLAENGLRYAQTAPRLTFEGGIIESNQRPYLDIIDSGPGLDPRIAEQLFEPFSTTEGQGTGLGLYIARELCESNQASLLLVEQSGGCRFRIVFAHPDRHQRLDEI
jgi:two-component system, NtrC family, sensor histidine kinase PilS